METLVGSPFAEQRYGWYYRPSSQEYEFWWCYEARITVHSEILNAMPDYIAMEIRASALVKPELTD
jgi:hypothetical protein